MTGDLFFSKEPFSASPGGEVIAIASTAAPGEEIHISGARERDEFDEIYLYAASATSTAVDMEFDLGGFGDVVRVTGISDPILILAGHPLRAGRRLRVWETPGMTSNLRIWGHVNRGQKGGV